jgi:hypothetical protein
MREVNYNELNGTGSYILTVTCRQCGQEINRTKLLQDPETVKRMYKDAETNPMLNWCQPCHSSGDVHIWEVNDGEPDGKVYLLSLEAQQEEIDQICFKKCGKISIGCVNIPTEDGEASFMPCRNESCKYVEKEIDLGKGKTQDGTIKHYVVRMLKR